MPGDARRSCRPSGVAPAVRLIRQPVRAGYLTRAPGDLGRAARRGREGKRVGMEKKKTSAIVFPPCRFVNCSRRRCNRNGGKKKKCKTTSCAERVPAAVRVRYRDANAERNATTPSVLAQRRPAFARTASDAFSGDTPDSSESRNSAETQSNASSPNDKAGGGGNVQSTRSDKFRFFFFSIMKRRRRTA